MLYVIKYNYMKERHIIFFKNTNIIYIEMTQHFFEHASDLVQI